MIFKTFNSDIDKISAKWGIFGKSFNEIGTAITGRISDINKGFQATDDLLGAFKDTDSIWKRLYPSKESIQSQMIDVDALYPEIDDSVAQKILNDLTQQQKLIDTTKGSWNDYFKEFQEGDKWQIEFVQNTDLQKASIDDVKKSYEGARQSALAHNEALKQQTLGAKAASVAMKGLSMVGNMLAFAAISKGIEILASAIDKYINRVKYAIEEAQTLRDDYNDFAQSSTENISSLQSQADEFEELSKGVTKYGENLSLSADEYDRYKSIVEEVLNYSPELAEGHNKEGKAIANKNSLIERSIELMKEEQRQKLKEMTSDESTGTIYEGAKASWDKVNAGYEGANTRNEIARWFDNNATSNGWNYEVDVARILGIREEWSDEGNNLKNAIINNIDTVAENIRKKKKELLALEDGKGVSLFTEEEIDNMIEQADEWAEAYADWQEEIEDSKHGMDDQFELYAQRADGYNVLTDAQKAFVSEYIKATGDIVNADGQVLSEDAILKKAKSYEKFVDKLATDPKYEEAKEKINELFSLDGSTIAAGEYEEQVDEILGDLQKKFDLTDDQVKDFKIALGFTFTSEGNTTTSELIKNVQDKLHDEFDDKVNELNLEDLEIASELTIDTEETKRNVESELKQLEQGGTVNLTLRPEVDTSVLKEQGWNAGEGTATVFSSTYSNKDGTKAVNFTPIIADPDTGEYLGCLTPDELTEYAEGVIAGTRGDDLNLQIGGEFKGKDAIDQACEAADEIHKLHERYYVDGDVLLSWDELVVKIKEAKGEMSEDDASISWSSKFDTLWNSEGFTEAKESLQDLAKESKITEDDIDSLAKENEELTTLLEESGMSAQFAATCFEKMCNGTGDFSSITNSTLALDQALHETESALLDVVNAKSKYDNAMSGDDYNTEFKNYQEAYASAMESFKNGEYGKKFRASMEYLLGEGSYSMSIEELYKSMKKLKSIFGEDANNGLEFLDKLYEKKDVLKELDSTLEKTADGGYKFDIKVEDFDNIGKSLGMTTEEVTACVEALGMFGDYADFDIDKVKDALDGMAISVDKTGSSTVSLQTLENALADLGYEGYEAYQILEQLRSQDDVKLLNFDVSNSEQVHSLINKLKELDAIHIDPSGAIDTSSLVQKMADFGMTSDQISTFIKQINELTTYHFDGNNFEDLKSIQTYVDGVLGNTDQSSTESMETLKDAEDGAKTSAENLQDAIERVNTTSVSSVTDGVSDLSDELNTANNKAITLKANLDKLNTNNLNTSNSNTSSSSSGGKLTEKDKTKTEATGTLAYAKGSKVTLDKDEEALVNELGEESVVRNGELHIIPGGAHIEKLKKGDIIFNHKQTEELKKNGRVTTNNGRGKVIGAFPSGTVSGKNPATKKNWSSSKDDKDKDKKNKSSSTDTTKFSQAIDWCAQSINKITSVIDKINAKLSSTNASLASQIKNYKQLINKQQSLINGYKKSETVYKKEYNKALKKLSKSDKKKVKDGTYRIEQFSGKAKSGKAKSGKTSKAEKRYNNIQSALEARDTYLDSQTDLVNAKNQLQEYAESLASVRWDKAAEQVEKLNNEISVLDTRMSNVSGYKAKNKILKEQLALQKNVLTKQENAYENTQSDANAYYKKISSKYKKNKNDDGTIKTKGVTNQTQLKYIKIYNAYVKKLAEETIELEQAQEDYTAAVQEAAVARAEYIKTDYDNKISLIDAKANQLDSQISLAEAKGQVASVEFYKQLQNNSNQRKTELEAEKKALQKQLANTRAYTDEWYEVKQMVIEVDEAIADETVNAVENINKQIEAMEKLKEAKNNYLSSTIGTYDWLESLTDTDDYYNEDGSFSDKGKAVAKGKIDKIKLYEQQAKNAQKNIDDLDAMYANNKDDPTYLNKRIELVEEWQNATKSMYDEQQSLHDMYINGLKEESEALQELIDKKMESLKADKAEYDYQKSIAEKTKNITDLEKQLAMLEGDNSEEARAKRQKVKVELEEAQQDLEDTQYDKYLERLENSLGDLQDRFDAVIDKLDKQGALPSIEEMKQLTDSNAASVTAGVEQIIKEAGLDQLLGEKGIGYLNPTTTELLTTPSTEISGKITTTNEWLEDIYTALSDGSSGTTEEDIVSIAEALGTYDSKNKTADTSGKSALNKYIMSQGYEAMDTQQMVTLKDAILNSKYSAGMDESLKETLTGITSANNLTKGKDDNYSDNKNAIMNALKYTKANEFISKNATKATKKKSEYGILNKKIYDITGGKVLSKADTLKLGSIFNVKDTDKSGGINADEAKKLVKLLENAGFANGGIVEAVRKNGDDGLATLKVGEAVLTPVQTTAFTKLAENIVPFNNLIGDIVERPNIPMVDRGAVAMTNNTIESVNFEFTLPNVVDSKSLIETIKTDTQVQRTLQNATVGKLNGNTRFGVNRI